MNEQIQIEEILAEANAVFQKNKVEWYASMLIDTIPEIDKVQAYQSAYWIMVTNEE